MSKRASTTQPRDQNAKPPTPAPSTSSSLSFAPTPPAPTFPGSFSSLDDSSSIPFSKLIARTSARLSLPSNPSSSSSPVLVQSASTIISPTPTPTLLISAPESRPTPRPPSQHPPPLPPPRPAP